jgi:hypothetical protein
MWAGQGDPDADAPHAREQSPIRLALEHVVLDAETEHVSNPDQLVVDAAWIAAGQARANLRQRLAVSLAQVEHGHGAEARTRVLCLASLSAATRRVTGARIQIACSPGRT